MIGILGGTGFVGKNLCDYLGRAGYKFVSGSRRTGVDATNIHSVMSWMKKHDVQQLVNLAAICGGIGLNKERPADLWASSTAISYNVLEASRLLDTNHVIMVGSVCSFAKDCPVPFTEDDLMHHGPPEPTNRAYGLSKLNALYGAQAYCAQYDMSISALIPVNMYGRYDHFSLTDSHVIPAMIRKFSDAKKIEDPNVTLWGDGSPTREFLHVVDLCVLVERLLIKINIDRAEFVNVGTGVETSMKDLANMISEMVGYEGGIIWDTSKPNGQPRRCLDVTKAKDRYGFEAQVDFAKGLEDTIGWYNEQEEKH